MLVTTVGCSNALCTTFKVVSPTVGINLATQRSIASVVIQNSAGAFFNLNTPIAAGTDGIPTTSNNGALIFSQSFLRTDYPLNNGAYRCQICGTNGGLGFLSTMSLSGTISGGIAQIHASNGSPGSGDVVASLPQAAPPSSAAGVIAIRNFDGGPHVTYQQGFDVLVDSSGKQLSIGASGNNLVGAADASGRLLAAISPFLPSAPIITPQPASVSPTAAPGPSATPQPTSISPTPAASPNVNTIIGSSAAGNLVYGYWGTGATVTDFYYVTYTADNTKTFPWITGTASATTDIIRYVDLHTGRRLRQFID